MGKVYFCIKISNHVKYSLNLVILKKYLDIYNDRPKTDNPLYKWIQHQTTNFNQKTNLMKNIL